MRKLSLTRPALLAVVAGSLSLGTASGQTIYGLRTDQSLVSFQPATPGTLTVVGAISGVTAGQTLVGMDFRPATGELIALGYDQGTTTVQLYSVNIGTAAATPIGAGFSQNLGAESAANIGFDFNPTVDRIRLVTADGNVNLRLNPVTGGLAVTDGSLAYAPMDANSGRNPNVTAVAYSNSYLGATSTTLYDADLDFGTISPGNTTIILSIQNPPNNGVLNTINTGAQGLQLVDLDIDIYNNLTSGVQTGYTVSRYDQSGVSGNLLGVIDFTTATIANQGSVGPTITMTPIVDIAVQIDRTAPAATGEMAYATTITGGAPGAVGSVNNLLAFDTGTPTFIRSLRTITGLAAGQYVAGLDMRPATGQLYALGYDPTNESARLYVIDPATGAATAIGAGPVTLTGLGTGSIGFDFNPTVDRIRVVSVSGANFRLNPSSGGIAATDGNLTAGSTIGAVGYTNSILGTSSTLLYDIDHTGDRLMTQNPPNSGTLNNVGPLGINISNADPTYGFDIRFTAPSTNAAFLTANVEGSTSDNLYTVDLGTGAATLVSRIGGGIAVREFAVMGTAPKLWAGTLSSDYGTAGNWSPVGVPTSSDRVGIPAGTPFSPIVSDAQAAGFLTVIDGATFTVASGGTFSLGGNLLNNGTFMGTGNGLVTLTGAASQTLSGAGSTVFADLTVGSSGATLGAAAAIERVLTLTGSLTTGVNVLTLRSSANGSAMVVNNGGVVNGNATVQRYITTSAPGTTAVGYRFLSAPVANTTVADLATAGFTPILNSAYNAPANPINVRPYPNVFGFNEARFPANNSNFQQGYFSPVGSSAQALDAALIPGRGYSVYMAGTAKPDFVGTLNNGNVAVGALTRTGNNPKTGWHLLGNPYPSPIDWDLVTVPPGMSSAVYTFRTTGGLNGSYVALVNGIGPPGTDLIAVGQGFFVTVNTPTSFTFTNAARVTSYANPELYRTAPDRRPTAQLTLRRADQPVDAADATYVYFQDGATAAVERDLDALKMRSEGETASIFTLANGQELAINGLAATAAEAVTVPLGVVLPTAGTYELNAEALRSFAASQAVTLVDARTNTTYDLTTQPTVRFTATTAGADLTRFSLRFGRGSATTAASTLSLDVYPNPVGRTTNLTVTALGIGQATTADVAIFDALGRAVIRQTVLVEGEAITASLDTRALRAGAYTLRVTPAGGVPLTRKVVVE